MSQKLKIQKPNGVVFHTKPELLTDIVLELNGGGLTEKQTIMAMADAAMLRDGKEVKIKGYTLQLEGDEHERNTV